jgi:hypothetical protein
MTSRVKSDFLYAQPSFGSGFARVFDLWGRFDEYNTSPNTEEADSAALASDWIIVGQDICDALKTSCDQDAA